MKKKIFIFGFLVFILILLGTRTSVFAADETTSATTDVVATEPIVTTEPVNIPETTTDEIVYECYVTINTNSYGILSTDIDGGAVGDIVTITFAAMPFCKLDYIKVNGVNLVANEDGIYSFVLISGENIVDASFVIDKDEVSVLVDMFEKIKNGDWTSLFTVENLLNLLSWAITMALSVGYLVALIKNKRARVAAINNTTEEAKKAIQANLNDFMLNVLEPIFTRLDEHSRKTDETCKTLARCFILSQENTPESRLAIIDELTKVQKNEEDLITQVKSIINEEVSKNEEIKKAKINSINELKEANDKIVINDTSGDTIDNESAIPTE